MPTSWIERFGEMTLQFLERLYQIAEELILKVSPPFNRFIERVEGFDRERIYPFFRHRDIDLKDYTIFKLQISSALFLILTTLFIIGSLSIRRYIITGGLVGIFSTYLIFRTVKTQFEDYEAYRDFFLSYHALAVLLAAIRIKIPTLSIGFPFFHYALVAVAGTIAIYGYFNHRYSRDQTYGKVLSTRGHEIEVKLNYDIRSNTKPQRIFLRNSMNAREGDRVKIKVRKGMLSLRGSTPVEVSGVEWS